MIVCFGADICAHQSMKFALGSASFIAAITLLLLATLTENGCVQFFCLNIEPVLMAVKCLRYRR